MELKKKLEACPNCNRTFPWNIKDLKYCSFCGKELPETEIIPLERLIAIEYERKTSNIVGVPISVMYMPQSTEINAIERSIDITVEEMDEYLTERKDNFIEITVDKIRNRKLYINKDKRYLITEFLITYQLLIDDDGDVTDLSVDISLNNEGRKMRIFLCYDFSLSFGVEDGLGSENVDTFNSFTEAIYSIMEVFTILPSYCSSQNMHNDFCPYALRSAIERAIDLYKTNHPDEYNSIMLQKEVED